MAFTSVERPSESAADVIVPKEQDWKAIFQEAGSLFGIIFKGNSQREAAKLGLLLLLQDKRQEAKMALRRPEALYRSQGHTDRLERIDSPQFY